MRALHYIAGLYWESSLSTELLKPGALCGRGRKGNTREWARHDIAVLPNPLSFGCFSSFSQAPFRSSLRSSRYGYGDKERNKWFGGRRGKDRDRNDG